MSEYEWIVYWQGDGDTLHIPIEQKTIGIENPTLEVKDGAVIFHWWDKDDRKTIIPLVNLHSIERLPKVS